MKVASIPTRKKFSPFDLVVTIESEEEARAIYAIFNYIPNTELLPDRISAQIRTLLGSKYDVLTPNTIARGVKYERFYIMKEKV